MSTTFNPDGTVPSSVNGWKRVVLASSTNTSPISITVGLGSHGFNDGDTVGIEGHSINTAANGLWVITVVSAATFSLRGSTGNGVGGATGYALDYSVLPQLTLPSDTDLVNAAAINTPIEGSSDVLPWLYKRAGAYALYGVYLFPANDSNWTSGPTSWLSGTQASSAAWGDITTLTYGGWSSTVVQPIVQEGDVLVATFTTSQITVGPSPATLPVALGIVLEVGTPAPATAGTRITGSAMAYKTSFVGPVSITATYTCVAADANKAVNFTLMMYGNAGSPNTYDFAGDRQLVIEHWRKNA